MLTESHLTPFILCTSSAQNLPCPFWGTFLCFADHSHLIYRLKGLWPLFRFRHIPRPCLSLPVHGGFLQCFSDSVLVLYCWKAIWSLFSVILSPHSLTLLSVVVDSRQSWYCSACTTRLLYSATGSGDTCEVFVWMLLWPLVEEGGTKLFQSRILCGTTGRTIPLRYKNNALNCG